MGLRRKYFWPMDTRTLRDKGCPVPHVRPTRQPRESQSRCISLQKSKPLPTSPLLPPARPPARLRPLQFPNPIQSLALDSILAKVRRSTSSVAAAAPAAVRANVIEIPSSPGPTAGAGGNKKKGRKRAPPAPLDLDGVEMWTPRQKRRLDDECCILAADPFAADEAPAVVPAADDDVAVVAERGKVACRDYPHPRSACARYPFSSTPHASHCEQCFCYVCDIAAPCVSWKGHGGHCHASDKDKKWKTMRMARQRQCK